ncbi:N-acetylmuramidase domain-containing protein [Algoriphagus aquimarinus]|uniref:Peptidoglycan-binding (PGRP) domain of peptidoglycan hydrolases-containing protein n=1 Tax=Algoriphagus aquimarinus TaxID=237018 RepID=A0A1I0YFZ2_9BACT|nr:N-acetylmuramidase family protein [Algoriphagus aquimarinus]SFB12279.1 Peptidoglycan-binding (PGRP) domain of peptidoglycan hydrolases-containing protein [Algoriphagus aquimarinus]
MQYIKLRSRGSSVSFLQELLGKLGYETPSSGYFGVETDVAVKDFQSKNQLVVDGEVGIKTWTLLFDKTKPADVLGDVFLGEQDLIDFAKRYQLDLVAVKAVNEVESSGKGFLIDGRPKILFEGHVFWRQLKARGINPEDFSNPSNETVLYKQFNKKHYLGGTREYDRLEQAASISSDPKFREAALSSASWGSYQVMGFHAIPLGYPSVQQFVEEMYKHERNHLEVFGRYILKNGCLAYLQAKNWAKFAECYNGSGYAQNKYDQKMAKAYLKFLNNIEL